MPRPSVRTISWLLGMVSVIVPIVLIYNGYIQKEEMLRNGRRVCGLIYAGGIIASIFLSSLVSLSALLVGSVGYFRVPKPRPKQRLVELAVLGLPLLLGTSFFIYLILYVNRHKFGF
jgi:uncharacterized membrane protein